MRPTIDKRWVGFDDVAHALAALGEVARDPDRTDAVGEFIARLTGPSADELLGRVWDDPVGRALLEEGRDLSRTLGDRAWLAALPEGSLGRVYHDWTVTRDFTADGIAGAISEQVPRTLDGPAATMAARIVDMHDLWHVLNGWDSDIHGEIHLLGFSYAQLGAWAWLGMGMLANLTLAFSGSTESIGYLRESIRRGRGAGLLVAVDWEAMLELPLDEVRRRVNIPPPVPYRRLDHSELARLRRTNPVHRLLRAVLPG